MIRTQNLPERRSFRSYLQREFDSRRGSDPNYSLRKFAKDLGEDPSALSRLMLGKVSVGPRTIKKLGRALLLGLDEIDDFLGDAKARRRRERGTSVPTPIGKDHHAVRAPDYQEVQADTFRVISDWYHFAILELMQLKEFNSDIAWISQKLGISPTDARLAIDRMMRIGLIEENPNGEYKDLTSGWTTNIAQPFFDPGHRRLQKQILEKAIRALETVPVSRRDQSSITLAFPSSRVGEAKQWIKEFRRKFNAEFGNGEDRDSVYQLSISLYPVTELKEKK